MPEIEALLVSSLLSVHLLSTIVVCGRTYLDSIFPLREVHLLLLLLLGLEGGLVCGESSSDGAGLLCSEIKWEVFLVLVEETEL